MKKGWIALGVVVVVILILGGWVVGLWNNLIGLDQNVQGAWGQVENQLQRRADLIPNLLETTKGLAAQERGVIQDIANARARIQSAGSNPETRIPAENQLTSALSRLLVIVENYPTLKSDQGFLRLMDELSGTENRLAVERKRYNDAVGAYNNAVLRVPGRLVASLAGYQAKPFFQAPPGAQQVPQVKF